jgi:hypothetical protein
VVRDKLTYCVSQKAGRKDFECFNHEEIISEEIGLPSLKYFTM